VKFLEDKAVKIEDFKIEEISPVYLGKDDYCPRQTVAVVVKLKSPGQWDGHWPSEEEWKEMFYKSAQPMLDDIREHVQKKNHSDDCIELCHKLGMVEEL